MAATWKMGRNRKKVNQMSKYTTEVRFICESKSGFDMSQMSQYTPDQIIAAARTNIFNFTYPIYDVTHKPALETKILKHYYTREIAAETYALWQLWLNDTLNLIMPKYNKLYEMEALSLHKDLQNIDVETVTEREDDFTRTDNLTDSRDHTRTDNLSQGTTGSATTADKYSDTPQGTVSNVDNNTYLTDYRNIAQSNSETVTNTGTQRDAGTDLHTGTQRNAGSSDTTVTEQGYRGSRTYMELLADYQDKILNIDMMIVRDLADCFLKIW